MLLCLRERNLDGGAAADLALQVDAGVVQQGDMLDDGQPPAGAAGGLAAAFVLCFRERHLNGRAAADLALQVDAGMV